MDVRVRVEVGVRVAVDDRVGVPVGVGRKVAWQQPPLTVFIEPSQYEYPKTLAEKPSSVPYMERQPFSGPLLSMNNPLLACSHAIEDPSTHTKLSRPQHTQVAPFQQPAELPGQNAGA